MNALYAEAGDWVLEASNNAADATLVVTLHNKRLYLDYVCNGVQPLRAACEFLRAPRAQTLEIGSFCSDLYVTLDWFPKQTEFVYLSVTKPENQSMAYALDGTDCQHLSQVFSKLVDTLLAGPA